MVIFIVVAALSAGLITLGVLYAQQVCEVEDPTGPVPTPETCLTKDCITAASRILNSMDTTANPCDDFFQYACGAWNEDHIISDSQSSISTFNDVRDSVSKTVKKVLEKEETSDRSSINKARDFYASCMDTETIDNLGAAPVMDLIAEMGGWPVLGDTFDANSWVLEDVLASFRAVYGTYSVITSYVSTDSKSSLEHILHLDQASLGLPSRDYYLDEATAAKMVPAYKQYIINFLMAIKSDDITEQAVNDFADEVIAFETDLAEISAPDSERRNEQDIYKNYFIKDLSTDISADFDWLKYINNILSVADDKKVVDGDEKIVVYAAEYLQNFFTTVAPKYTEEFMQGYFVWRIMKGRNSYMSKTLRDTAAPYNEIVRGVTAEQQRWMTCSDATDGSFPMPVGALFVEEAFPEENKLVTEELVANLKAAMQEIIDEATWMDLDTQIKASEKLEKITTNIAYPEYIMDPKDPKMDNDYAKITVNKAAYFENIQQLTELGESDAFGKLKTPVDKGEWFMGPATVNAYYSPSQNAITFPAGILQPPFYDAGQPISMNYGGIGMVIGHEITHGFDDSGAQFDGDGNLNNWWSDESLANFNNLAWCMKQQYSEQYWDEAQLYVNGNLTIGENIADNGGIRESFVAYKAWQNSNSDYNIPGFDEFTSEQLYFLGQAQVWCGKTTEARAVQLQKTDPHSPGKFRVNVPALNFEEFGKAFSCELGVDYEYPDPKDTCRVW